MDWGLDSYYKNKFETILNDNGLKQNMYKYTRITSNSRTIIGYVVSNIYNKINHVNQNLHISDHETIKIELPGRTPKMMPKIKKVKP